VLATIPTGDRAPIAARMRRSLVARMAANRVIGRGETRMHLAPALRNDNSNR